MTTRAALLSLKYFAVTLVIIAALYVGMLLIGEAIKRLSKKPPEKVRFFAPIPDPGTFLFISKNGRIDGVIENVSGQHLDDYGRFMPGDKDPGFWERRLGVDWIGPYGEIHILQKWEWPEVSPVEHEKDGKKIVVYETIGRAENIWKFFYQMTFSSVIEGLELEGNIKVNLELSYIVHFLYPERVISRNKDVVTTFINIVTDAIRPWMGGRNFDAIKAIISSKNKSADQLDEGFWEMLENLNGIQFDDDIPLYNGSINLKGLYHLTGIVIKKVNFTSIMAVGKAAEAIEAKAIYTLEGLANVEKEQQAYNAAQIKAQSDADAMDKRSIAEKRRIFRTMVAPTGGRGPQVAKVLVAEKVGSESSKVRTWVQGNEDSGPPKAIVAIPPDDESSPQADKTTKPEPVEPQRDSEEPPQTPAPQQLQQESRPYRSPRQSKRDRGSRR